MLYSLKALPLLFALVANAATAQTITLTKIVDETTAVRGYGHSPALDAGVVAFLGEDATSKLDGVYKAPADGLGPITIIVDETRPLPNLPAEKFVFLDNPDITNGAVTFTAGYNFSSKSNEGIYRGSGGPLTVVYDHTAFPTSVNPFEPIVDGSYMVFRSAGYDSSTFLDGSLPYNLTGIDTFSPIVTGPMPGGGTILRLQNLDDTLAMSAGRVAFSAELNHPGGFDSGVYTWDPNTLVTSLIANWNSTMPGTAFQFENCYRVATDGTNVAFVGQAGLLGFGGHQGVYQAPFSGGPLQTIAQIGDVAPGSTLSFSSFGNVGVEGDLTIFEGFSGSALSPSLNGIYGHRNGVTFKIVDSDDQVSGLEIHGATFDPRGLDGDQLAMRVTFVNPTYPTYAIDFGVYVATISTATCQKDLGYAGPGTSTLTVCGEPLLSGKFATLKLEGAPAFSPVLLGVATQSSPAFFPILGGTIVPSILQTVIVTSTDAVGAVLGTVPGGGGPATLYVQGVVVDPSTPSGFAITNALEVQVLP